MIKPEWHFMLKYLLKDSLNKENVTKLNNESTKKIFNKSKINKNRESRWRTLCNDTSHCCKD